MGSFMGSFVGMLNPAMPAHSGRRKPKSGLTGGRKGFAVAILVCGLGFLPWIGLEPAFARGPDNLADLVAKVSDAVVNISATQDIDDQQASNGAPEEQGAPFDQLFQEFMRRHHKGGKGAPLPRQFERHTNSLGSGFVIDPSGIIITNNHVIADANDVTVIFDDGRKLKAKIIGKDSKVDVAVLKVKSDKPLKAVKFGDSDKVRVGDWVIAVGNPFGLGGSVTAGIISARHRNIDSGPYDNYFQTDAAINKGNSGGPLFDLDGDVIGINTAILSPSGGSIGIGFATPAATVIPIIKQLEKYGVARRGWLGVRIQNVDDSIAESLNLGKVRGALVAGTDEKGPAKAAGIKAGDVIVKFNGADIKDAHELPKIVASAEVGKEVQVVVVRDGKELTKTVKLGLLSDADKKPPHQSAEATPEKNMPAPVAQKALGMVFSDLNETSRLKFSIKESIASGVVVDDVDQNSPAADKHIQPGEVIEEVNQEPVKTPSEVVSKLQALKSSGKKLALLLVANPQGDVRFVAVALH
ncbi:MAG: Do family serine endopeptidase [Beijerinckiaceae bacterium]|nr:MAG: Do family serine endopeptidase [Beijerinckiaceae bacterium]